MTVVDNPGSYFSSRILRLQAPYQEGEDIKILQSLLNLLPDRIIQTRIDTDGIFGFETRRAVRQFQNYFKLDSNGIVGNATFYYLGHCSGKFSKTEPVFSSRIICSSSRGGDVQILQNRLAAYKKTFLNRPANGKYDLYTAQAVSRIQDDFSIQGEEGMAGPQTYAAVLLQSPLGGRILKKGRHGLDTYYLQLYLYRLGHYNLNPDGFFTTATFKALKGFQSAADIRVDGIAGPQTFLALGNSLPFPQNEFLYRSEAGDSIFSTATLFKKAGRKVPQFNGLKLNRKRLEPGQLLKIPAPLAFHLLEKGDSIDKVAEKYGISPEKLIKANRLQFSLGLLPGETLVLPGYQVKLSGCIIYLNRRERQSELKCLHLEDMSSRTLHIFNNHDIHQISIDPSRKKVILSTHNGWQCTCDLNDNRLNSLPQSRSTNIGQHLIKTKSWNNKSNINECSAKWWEGNIHLCKNNYSLTITAVEQIIKQFRDKDISHCVPSPDGVYVLVFASIHPVRRTAAYLFNLDTGQLIKLGENNIDGVFSTDSRQFLLTSRECFGAHYPWFYKKIRLFSSHGYCLGDEILTRSAEVNEDCFNRHNTAFVLVMHNPHAFYPLPNSKRHLYIKKLNSSLLLQLTSDEKPLSPVWI